MEDTKKIRGLYGVLQGYISQAPDVKDTIDEEDLWNQVNSTIDELGQIVDYDFKRYKIVPKGDQIYDEDENVFFDSPYVAASVYRAKIIGLIMWLHGVYFSNEPAPFSNTPSQVITQTQEQSQSLNQQMLIDFSGIITEKIDKLDPADKKRLFLEKLKTAMGTVRNYAGFISLCLKTAKECGLALNDMLELFVYGCK
jgi:hypothetical protein